MTTATDEQIDLAVAWTAAVREALEDSTDRHGADVDALIDETTTEGFAFLELLDPIVDADPDDPAFAVAVQQAAEAYVNANPGMRVTEATEQIEGRVLEAKGTDTNGGRVFRVQILKYGTSRNGNHYTEGVMRAAAPLYDGAKAYDHHRSAAELQSSTLTGLVGSYRNVEATQDGLYGDLHLLPSAVHTAEALDATIVNQAAGLPSLVGISHDVMANFKPGRPENGRRVREAVSITAVQSADVVADPSAGGQAVRVVQGGTQTTPSGADLHIQESEVPVNTADVLAALSTASSDQLAAVGLSRTGTPTTESVTPPVRVVEGRTTEGGEPKSGWIAQAMIAAKAKAAGLDSARLTEALPDRITESDVDNQIALAKSALAMLERQDLVPQHSAQVTRESHDKKVEGLDLFFKGDFNKGYRSFRDAFIDITGRNPRAIGEDFNRIVMRESVGGLYDSSERATESMSASTWNVVLGDSITRRLIDEYNQPDLQNWRQIVSSVVPINDFRTQRIDRIGGYGTLPAVTEGAPYQPLTSPANEEITYSITKRGGTEDITLEMIANDDVRAISKIPTKLGLAAANTLYQFVWNFLTTLAGTATNSGPTIYDSTTLFNTGHANFVNSASGSALSQSALSAGRLLMRSQTAYGDTSQFIAPTPKFLVALNDIEELAWQLVTSAVALPTAANTPPQSTGAANTPNLHQNLQLIVLDYIANATSTTAWWLVADPARIPTLEIGFYQGRQEPELFTQADQTVGSMFNADRLTYKIRHIYSGAVLDYRGFVKGNV